MSCLHDGIFHFLAKAEPCLEKEILEAFKVFDCDGTGKISFEDLKVVAREVGEDITDEELQVCEAQTFLLCSARGGRGASYCGEDCSGDCAALLCSGRNLSRSGLVRDLHWCLHFVSFHSLRPSLTWSPNLCYPTGDD